MHDNSSRSSVECSMFICKSGSCDFDLTTAAYSRIHFGLYFLEVYFYVFLMNPREKRSACPEEWPKFLFMFGFWSLDGRIKKRGVQQRNAKAIDDHLDEKFLCHCVQPAK